MATSSSYQITATEDQKETYHPRRPRKFAPLKSGSVNRDQDQDVPKLRGIVFDVDGTLCLPQNYMFREMRSALDIPKSTDILDHIRSLSSEPDQKSSDDREPSSPQSRASEAIRQIERNAMSVQEPQPGLVELMKYLEDRKVPKALCTRNFLLPVEHLIETFLSELKGGFDMIITRETKGVQPKPSPEGLWKIAQKWGLDQEAVASEDKTIDSADGHDPLEVARRYLGQGMIMVGDSIDDMASGYRAGAATVLLVNEDNKDLAKHKFTDLSIHRLDELVDILEDGFEGKP